MATKDEIITSLTSKGVEHDPNAPKATLEAILATHPDASVEVAPVVDSTVPKSELQLKWEAYLVKARASRRDPTIFDQQVARGELNTPPIGWIG